MFHSLSNDVKRNSLGRISTSVDGVSSYNSDMSNDVGVEYITSNE